MGLAQRYLWSGVLHLVFLRLILDYLLLAFLLDELWRLCMKEILFTNQRLHDRLVFQKRVIQVVGRIPTLQNQVIVRRVIGILQCGPVFLYLLLTSPHSSFEVLFLLFEALLPSLLLLFFEVNFVLDADQLDLELDASQFYDVICLEFVIATLRAAAHDGVLDHTEHPLLHLVGW